MKFSKLSQLFLVSMIGLLVATLLTACQLVTIDYVYLAETQVPALARTAPGDGQIEAFAVDSQSGALRTGPPRRIAGGTSPVAMAVSPDYGNLYVANQGNNSVVHFAIAANGTLTKRTPSPSPMPRSISP